MTKSIVRNGTARAALLLLAALAACDNEAVLTGTEAAPTVVFGRIAAMPGPQPAGPALAPASAMAGIVVSTEDGSASTTTDERGAFRLEVQAEEGRVRIRFRRGSLDMRLELSGLPEGGVFQIDLSIDDDGVTVLSSSDSDEADFDGLVTGMTVTGAAPERTATLQVVDSDESFTVAVVEGDTDFDQDEDIVDFDSLLEAAANESLLLEVDGEGSLQADGRIVAAEIKVEIEDGESDSDDDANDDSDDDSNDAGDFDGAAALVELIGDAPARTARVDVTNLAGTTTVEITEGTTAFDPLGDAITFDAMLDALTTDGLEVEIEGDGTVRADGTVVATAVKVETNGDDDVNDPADFDGAAVLVEVIGDAPARTARVDVTNLAGTTSIEINEGTTIIDPLGDALTFDAMLAALTTDGLQVEIEGDGTVRADGTVVATAVKVETES